MSIHTEVVSWPSLATASEDFRHAQGKRHLRSDMLRIAVCAGIGGVHAVAGIAEFGRDHQAWCATWLALPHGIPSHDTFDRVLPRLDPQPREALLARWVASLAALGPGTGVAVDGQTRRRSHDRSVDLPALQLVSAWSTAQGLTLGQEAVAPQSHAITALPELLQRLTLAGCIVTMDAMGTQKEMAQTSRAQGADYMLAVQGHPSTLQAAVQDTFALARTEDAAASPGPRARHTTVHGGHGRIETRHCRVIGDPDILQHADPHGHWPDRQSLIEVESIRRRGTQRTTQTRHFISSCPPAATALWTAIRGHWGIANSLHWVLDVAFREDECRLRKGHAALNMAVLRRTAHLLLRRNTRTKLGIENKRLKAGRNLAYMEEILGFGRLCDGPGCSPFHSAAGCTCMIPLTPWGHAPESPSTA